MIRTVFATGFVLDMLGFLIPVNAWAIVGNYRPCKIYLVCSAIFIIGGLILVKISDRRTAPKEGG